MAPALNAALTGNRSRLASRIDGLDEEGDKHVAAPVTTSRGFSSETAGFFAVVISSFFRQVVVYAWDMHALRAFIKRRPLIGACLQKAISEDFVNKVDQSRGHKKRYRLLLEEALDGGEINLTEKKKLQRWDGQRGGGRREAVEAVDLFVCCVNALLLGQRPRRLVD